MTPNLTKAISALALAGVCAFAQEAQKLETEESNPWKPTIALGVDWAFKDVSEGKVGSEDAIFDVDAHLSLQGFTLGVTATIDSTDINDKKNRAEEYDFYIGYEYTFEDIATIGLKYTYCQIPSHNADDYSEFEFDLNAECFLKPGIAILYDDNDGVWYGNFNISYEKEQLFEACPFLGLKTTAELWWGNGHYVGTTTVGDEDDEKEVYIRNHGCLYSFVTTLELPCKFNDHITFTPYTSASWALNHDVRKDWRDDENNSNMNIFFGLKLDFEF